MNPIKSIAFILIVVGALALGYGGFSYTKTHRTHVGPMEFSMHDQERVNIPVWAGVAAIVIGASLLLAPVKKT